MIIMMMSMMVIMMMSMSISMMIIMTVIMRVMIAFIDDHNVDVKVPKSFPAELITIAQILQMLVGSGVCISCWYYRWVWSDGHDDDYDDDDGHGHDDDDDGNDYDDDNDDDDGHVCRLWWW